MKRFVFSVLLFSVCVCTLVILSAFYLPDNSIKNSMLGIQRVKLERLKKIDGKRLIFLGGSNLSHGLDSAQIEKELGVRVVNMGLHAGLGLRYIMWVAIEYIRPDDIVVIVPEYSHFCDTFNGGPELLAMVADVIPRHKALLNKNQWFKIFEYVPRYGAGKLCRFWKCIKDSEFTEAREYTVQGDRLPTKSIKPLPNNQGAMPIMPEALDLNVIEQIYDFLVSVRERGGKAVLIPPCFQRTSFLRQKKYISFLSSRLKDYGMSFLTDPEDFTLNDEFFYDTPYHLNALGYPVRTRLVINALEDIVR